MKKQASSFPRGPFLLHANYDVDLICFTSTPTPPLVCRCWYYIWELICTTLGTSVLKATLPLLGADRFFARFKSKQARFGILSRYHITQYYAMVFAKAPGGRAMGI